MATRKRLVLTHPISRIRIVLEKLISMLLQILFLNIICATSSYIAFVAIGENVDLKTFVLFHLAFFIMQCEVAAICFGISACLKRGNIGIGIGIATYSYVLNIVANISDKVKFLKFVTPFGYTEPADIITEVALDMEKVMIGLCVMVLMIIFAFIYYNRKDINA